MGTGELPVFLPWIPTPEGTAGRDHPGCHRCRRHRATCKQLYNRGCLVGGGPCHSQGGQDPGRGTGPHLEPVPGVGWYPASDELVGCAEQGCPEAPSGVPEQGPSSLSVVERPVQLPSYPVQLNKPVTDCLPASGTAPRRVQIGVCVINPAKGDCPPDRHGTGEVLGSSCGPHVAGGPRAPPLL